MSKSEERDVIEQDISFCDLPDNYPLYLLFVPTAMSTDNEKKIYERLKEFGTNMGENLCVARIDQRKSEYREFLAKIGKKDPLGKPAIIIIDKNEIAPDTLIIRLDEPGIVGNEEKLIELIPKIIDLLLCKEEIEAIKQVVRETKKTQILSALRPAAKLLAGVKIKVTIWNLVTIEKKL